MTGPRCRRCGSTRARLKARFVRGRVIGPDECAYTARCFVRAVKALRAEWSHTGQKQAWHWCEALDEVLKAVRK